MRWLQNISSSASSSSSVSTAPSKNNNTSNIITNHNNNNNNDNKNNNDKKYLRGPRLTRQKKLRHLSDQEVVGTATSAKANADVAESVSLSPRDNSDHSSSALRTLKSSPVPLPLPLPVRVDPGGKCVDERDRDGLKDTDRVDGAPERVFNSSPNSPIASVFSRRVGRKMPEFFHTRSPRTGYQEQNSVERSRDNFRLNIPAKSAPTSPYTSPVRSPQRRSVYEMFQYKVPNGNQGWSAPEMPILDIPVLPPPAFFDYTVFSAESSPFHSPRSRSPCRNAISPSGPSSPIHPKLSRESTVRIEVHPLPLPPGAGVLSPSAPSPQVPAKPEPLLMNSQWQKGKPIGRGTFGSVYVASNRETGALCAMKEVDIFPDDPKSAESIKQLEQEIKVLSHLKHPNIVQYYGSEIVEDKFYIYLEYVHPGSIDKYVREHCGAITESVVRNFTRHILSGLAYLHSKKTIHRDIKGANLLVDALGVVKLADFGMAKHLTGQAADLSLKGSPYWMAPELMMAVMQKDNNSDSALAVDIWSLGCTIIEMYTGKPPWSGYEGAAAMFKVMRDTPAIPDSLSPEGKDFLRCCFRRNPAERPSASMLLEHRFLKNFQQPDVPSCSPSFSGMKLTEKKLCSPRERSDDKFDQVVALPSSRSPKKATLDRFVNYSFSSERISQPSHLETSDITVASVCSPRSTLEALPGLSPQHSGPSTRQCSTSSIVLGLIGRGSKKNRVGR